MEHDPLIVSLKQKRAHASDEGVPTKKRRARWPFVLLVFVIAVVSGAVYVGYPYLSTRTSVSIQPSNMTDDERASEVADTIARVSELIVLPEGEDPTVATVTDPEKLQDQAFFVNAKAGHRVLLYTKARKAYLYDPEAHRLIEVAPISTEVQ